MSALHWRLREFMKRREFINFQKVTEETSSGPLRNAGLKFEEGDLALGGAPLAEAPEKLVRTALSISRERLMAIEWLRGRHPVYSEVKLG
jgi:hypothetical protein